MAFFVMTSQSGLLGGSIKYIIMKYALIAVSTIVPRLDFFAKTQWLVYGFDTSQDWIVWVVQTAVFLPLLLLASIADFRRKQF
jgi:hypothetical protein